MPSFYASGTVAVTNGSAAVTGTGTAWVAKARAGWALQFLAGGDLAFYEIASVNSDTSITLTRAYGGTTGSGRAYQVVPGAGLTTALRLAVEAAVASFQTALTGIAAGIFPDGSVGTPALRFGSDLDTGLRRKSANVLALVAGGADQLEITTAGAILAGLLSGTAVQQSVLDGTAGRLLSVGNAFGLGGIAPLPPNDDLNDCTTTGPFRFNSTTLNRPFSASGGVVFAGNRTTGTHGQIAVITNGADAGQVCSRARDGSSWGSWARLFGTTNVLGTVSQSSGVPTGALIESGSNANGFYVRWANGTQMCRLKGLDLSNSGETTWTFPAAFTNADLVVGAIARTSGVLVHCPRVAAVSATACDLSTINASNARTGATVDVSAIGRWF